VLYSKRVRKKKRITDLVVIIPFPKQGDVDVLPKSIVVKTSVSSVSNYAKIEPKILTVPSGQLNTSNVSIKKILQPVQEDPSLAKYNENLTLTEKFNFDQVKMAWRRYAFEVKAKGMETFYSAMIKRDPKIKDEVNFTMEVDNQVQIDYISNHIQDLVGFLRQELKNYLITVDFFLTEDKESEVKFLTGKDRFASMARKNPNLHSFKNIFNLDIEF
jgi:hypothetical protein